MEEVRFGKPVQLCFRDFDGDLCWGIGYLNEIICSCCGGTFDPDEVEIVKVYDDWANFLEAIRE